MCPSGWRRGSDRARSRRGPGGRGGVTAGTRRPGADAAGSRRPGHGRGRRSVEVDGAAALSLLAARRAGREGGPAAGGRRREGFRRQGPAAGKKGALGQLAARLGLLAARRAGREGGPAAGGRRREGFRRQGPAAAAGGEGNPPRRLWLLVEKKQRNPKPRSLIPCWKLNPYPNQGLVVILNRESNWAKAHYTGV
jgi:hypothetical protein